MADLDVQVQLSLRDDLSRPAKKAMDAVRAASRTAEGGMGGVAKQAAKAGDAVEGMGRAARDAGEATAALARSNGPRSVKQQADGATRSLENMARSGQRAGQSLSQADAQAGRLRRTLDGVSSRMQAVTRQAARLGQGLGTGINGAMEAGAGLTAAGAVGRAALAAPINREQQYLYDATVAFNDRSVEGIRAGVAELRALDQQIVARGGGTLDSARAMRGAFMAGGVDFADVARLAPLTQRAATAAGAEGADFANTLMAGAKSGQFAYGDAEKVFGMMLTAGASGSFETRDMAQYLPGIFNATGDMRGMTGTAYHLAGLETIRDATGDSAEAANRYQNLLSFRNSKEAYSNLSKKGINLAHVYRDAAKRGEDMNLAFVGAIQGLVERNKEYKRLKKELPGATGARADEIRNQMGAIQNRIFSEIIGDMQARQGAIALQNGRGRYGEIYGDLTKAPEAMIDKLFSVMTSATQENFNRLGNELGKGHGPRAGRGQRPVAGRHPVGKLPHGGQSGTDGRRCRSRHRGRHGGGRKRRGGRSARPAWSGGQGSPGGNRPAGPRTGPCIRHGQGRAGSGAGQQYHPQGQCRSGGAVGGRAGLRHRDRHQPHTGTEKRRPCGNSGRSRGRTGRGTGRGCRGGRGRPCGRSGGQCGRGRHRRPGRNGAG